MGHSCVPIPGLPLAWHLFCTNKATFRLKLVSPGNRLRDPWAGGRPLVWQGALPEAGPDRGEAAPWCNYIRGYRGPHRELWIACGPSEMPRIKARGPDFYSLVPTSQRTRAASEGGRWEVRSKSVICRHPQPRGESVPGSWKGPGQFTARHVSIRRNRCASVSHPV